MQYLFHSWASFSSAVKAAAHVLLLSDYDGTLTPIVGRPEEAILSPEVRKKLDALTQRSDFSVGIISGRALSEIQSMVGLDGIYYAGNHGLEISGPGLRFVSPEAKKAQAKINELARQFAASLGHVKGVIVEDKGLSLSVHYRLVKPDEVKEVEGIFQQITAPAVRQGGIRVTSGKKVWEARPPIDWHKGKAVEAISQEIKALLRVASLLTVYLGDDTTDEDAFRVLRRPQGWSIFVGPEGQSSSADYFLRSTPEVAEFLSRLPGLK